MYKLLMIIMSTTLFFLNLSTYSHFEIKETNLAQCFNYNSNQVKLEKLGKGNVKLSIGETHAMYLYCMDSSKRNKTFCYDYKNVGMIEYSPYAILIKKPLVLTSIKEKPDDLVLKIQKQVMLKNCHSTLASR